jgi:hypothetical protein
MRTVSWWWSHPLDATDGGAPAGRGGQHGDESAAAGSYQVTPSWSVLLAAAMAQGRRIAPRAPRPVRTRVRPTPQPPRRRRGGLARTDRSVTRHQPSR